MPKNRIDLECQTAALIVERVGCRSRPNTGLTPSRNTNVIEGDLSAVQAFLGRVSDPKPSGEANDVKIDSALRAIMFTDIVGSTSMTERLGDACSVEMVRAHDALVRRALKDKGGHVVKHTGDGIMATFADAAACVQCARAIQQAFEAFNLAGKESRVGEPIADSNDLFGATVQLAARLCQLAEPDAILDQRPFRIVPRIACM
jgi:class 3 adenylate cyclase